MKYRLYNCFLLRSNECVYTLIYDMIRKKNKGEGHGQEQRGSLFNGGCFKK